MDESEDYQRKADRLLHAATRSANFEQRRQLIEEALHWHNLAMDTRGHSHPENNDNDGDEEDQARA